MKKNENEFNWKPLPKPDDSLQFFESFKKETERFWVDLVMDREAYGFQTQSDSRWKPGLNDSELNDFQLIMGFTFPLPLLNFYKKMNGLTKQGINLYACDGTPETYQSIFYSYPDDIPLINEYIDWILDANKIEKKDLNKKGISRIFPVYQHRFMLIDVPGNPILSMWGNDIIYYADNLSKILVKDICPYSISNSPAFKNQLSPASPIAFWLD